MNKVIAAKVVLPLVHAVRRESVSRWYAHLLACEDLDAEAFAAYRFEKLAEIVAFAEDRLPFYRHRFRDAGVRASDLRSPADLARFPLLAKGDLAALREDARRSRLLAGRTVLRMTAGSSGDPAVVYADPEANAFSLAARRRAYLAHGLGPGDRELRLWGRPLASGRWRATLKNAVLNRLQLDSQQLSPVAWAGTRRRIDRFAPDYAYGYTSLIALLADYVQDDAAGAGGLGLRAAICTSETSTGGERRRIGEVLDCRILNEYGCSETDIIAFECPAGGLHVTAENVHIEVLDENGAPASQGEIVVTDLNNRAMPLVRYRIGDIGAISQTGCVCGRHAPCFASITGRVQGQYLITADGTRIHSQTVAYMFEDLVNRGVPVRRFRAIQETGDHIRLIVAADSAEDSQKDSIRALVQREFGKLAGGQFRTSVEFVSNRDLYVNGKKYRHFESRI
jgi:phenylacetate-CoA ligase